MEHFGDVSIATSCVNKSVELQENVAQKALIKAFIWALI